MVARKKRVKKEIVFTPISTKFRLPASISKTQIIWGKVRVGRGRGQKMGFPTLNFSLHKKVPDGVYVALAKVDRLVSPALTFIGAAKTFGETRRHVEVYFLDSPKNFNGKWLSTTLLCRLRGSQKFTSSVALVKAMQQDRRRALRFFKYFS